MQKGGDVVDKKEEGDNRDLHLNRLLQNDQKIIG